MSTDHASTDTASPDHLSAKERRRFTRFPFDAEADLVQNGQVFPVELHDVSLRGLLVRRLDTWLPSPEEEATARIHLDDSSQIEAQVILAHREGALAGFRILRIDLDSITHLRRLCELRLGSDEALARELSALVSHPPAK